MGAISTSRTTRSGQPAEIREAGPGVGAWWDEETFAGCSPHQAMDVKGSPEPYSRYPRHPQSVRRLLRAGHAELCNEAEGPDEQLRRTAPLRCAVLYDQLLSKLEELSLCGQGFAWDGKIELRGSLPMNTHGGQFGGMNRTAGGAPGAGRLGQPGLHRGPFGPARAIATQPGRSRR